MILAGIVTACGGSDGPSEPQNTAPTITVSGVTDGEIRKGPVTIMIAVDQGTFSATLNGETFFSGRTVEEVGSYSLAVTARNGEATATLALGFAIDLAGEGRLIIRMLDLGANSSGGGGDAVLITDSTEAGVLHALVDAGPSGPGGSDPDHVGRRLAALGVDTLEVLVLSHAHADHFDGIPGVLARVHVRRFVYNGQVRTFSRYDQTVNDARAAADDVVVPTSATDVALGVAGRSTLTLLPALATFLQQADADGSEINEGSIGVELRLGSFRMFLTGDGEVQANVRWRTQFSAQTGDVDVLKVGHHGANDATFDNGFNGSSSWLVHTSPEVALVTANGVTHPRINALAALLALSGTDTYCTNTHGEVEVRVADDGSFVVTVEKGEGQECTPGSEATS